MPVEGLLCSQILSHALCGLPNLKDVHIDPLSRKISAIEIFNHLEALSGTELTVGTSYPLCAFIQALAEASKTLQTFSLGWDDSRYSEEERESFREIAGVRPSVRRFLRRNGAHNYLNAHDLNEASNSIEPDRLISLFYQLKELKITGLKGPYMSDGAQNLAGVTHQTLSHISMLTDVDLGEIGWQNRKDLPIYLPKLNDYFDVQPDSQVLIHRRLRHIRIRYLQASEEEMVSFFSHGQR